MINTIYLPLSPENYYGTASTMKYISELPNPPTFYVGPSRDVVELKGVSLRKLDDNTYQFLVRNDSGEEFILSGTSLTRVNLKNESR